MKNEISSSDLQSNLTVRLPDDYPWKVLDKLIEDHSYCISANEEAEIRHICRTRDYKAYLALSDTWGPCGIDTSGTQAVIPFRSKYQIASLMKKYRFPSDNKERKSVALKKFRDAEDACKSYNLTGYKEMRNLSDPVERSAFTYAVAFMRKLLNPYIPEFTELTEWSRHGPGANLDTKQGRTSLYDKYTAWPYSCTKLASGYARDAIQQDERWLGALENSYREWFNIPKEHILNQDDFWSEVIEVVDANRIAFVPKNALTDRSIAIEPSLNLYLQLGVDGYIRRRLKRWGVDLDDQRKNQRLALEGSREHMGEDPYVTIDLAAASDTVSLSICETLLPSEWFNYLYSLRSPSGVVGNETVKYEKISSMGNGYTFALESAIFTSLVYGVMKTLRGTFQRDDFAVYGDDIIVRRSESDLLVRMLSLAGFSTNTEKSFFNGPFRESCGADFYNGEPVRPVFLTEKPSTVIGVWNDHNRLQRLLWLRSLDWESKTLALCRSWIPEKFIKFQGPFSDTEFDTYLHVPMPTVRYRNSVWRFNRVVLQPKRLSGGKDFFMRKLMHSLRVLDNGTFWNNVSSPWSPRSWGGGKVQLETAGGTVFALTDNKSVTVSVAPTQTSIWSGEYVS